MTTTQSGKKARHVVFWITLTRALLAITLGVALLVNPEKRVPTLANFMGMYWLTSGVISLRWGLWGERPRLLAALAGVVGILAGLTVLGRSLISGLVTTSLSIYVLGTVILLTGLLHIFGGFRTADVNYTRTQSLTSLLLGIFEVILGALLMITPLQRGSGIYLAAASWALLGGFILIGDAMRIRRKLSQTLPPEPVLLSPYDRS